MNILISNTQIKADELSFWQNTQNIANDYYSPVTTSSWFAGESRTVRIEDVGLYEKIDATPPEGMGGGCRIALTCTIVVPIFFAIAKIFQFLFFKLSTPAKSERPYRPPIL